MSGWPVITRTSDPDTSRAGETQITTSGRRASLVEEVVEYVRAHPGQCRGEIAIGMGLDEYALSKRLSDAKNLGHIAPGDSVRFRSRLQSRWYPSGMEPVQTEFSL